MLGKMPKICSRKSKMKMVDNSNFDEFLSRISKTLYYGDKFNEEDHLSYPVIELATEIYSDLKTGKSIDRLYLNEAAEITQSVKVNPCYLVLALLYIERLKDCNSTYLDNVAPSQLFLISLVLASKFHSDGEYELSLAMFEKFSEWSQSDMFGAELAFLEALQWNTHVSEAEFYVKLVELETCLARRLGGRRGWFTYTEMNTLLDATWLTNVTHLLATVSCVCLTTYTAGVFTLIASSALASPLSASVASFLLSSLTLSSHPSTLIPSLGLMSLFAAKPMCHGTSDTELLAVEEELEALVDENRLGEVLARLEELERLPPGNVDGRAEEGGLLELDRVRLRAIGSWNAWTTTLESEGFRSGNAIYESGMRILNSPSGSSLLGIKELTLERFKETALDCGKSRSNGYMRDGKADIDLSPMKMRSEDGLYIHIPNSTSFMNVRTDSDLPVCLNSINAEFCGQDHSSSRVKDVSCDRKSAVKTIPLESACLYTLPDVIASLTKFPFLEYFKFFPLSNASNFLFKFEDFDWNLYDRSEISVGKDRYFQETDRNGYRLVEKGDLKF